MSDIYLIDGQALDPSYFGETDATTGSWKAKAYSGTYGTNGFHFDFTDSTTLGNDVSGNGNDWTSNNLDATDQVRDTPTNNFAMLSPINKESTITLSQGNLRSAFNTNDRYAIGTFCVSSGKWYWEYTLTTAPSSGASYTGVVEEHFNPTSAVGTEWGYRSSDGNKYNGGASAYGASFTTGDVIGVALDMDSGSITFYKNNTSQGTAFTNLSGNVACPYNTLGVSGVGTQNFGQGGQSGLTYYAAAGGSFKYAPPQGFKALSTSNLPKPAIPKPSNFFDAKTYTGNGSTLSVSGLNFQPSLTWIKRRSAPEHHWLTDAVRGVTKGLYSNLTNAEATRTDQIQSFNADGFSLGADAAGYTNVSGQTYISWNWLESPTAGFDIVTYTGNGANRTIAHSLGVAPSMMIIKARNSPNSTDRDWYVYHRSLGGTKNLWLNSTAAVQTLSTIWNNTDPTSSVFSLGTENAVNNATGVVGEYIAYLFAEVPGFSKFGSYTGNGSADGPFVYTGFKPRWVMIKRTDATGSEWDIRDTARAPYNAVTAALTAENSQAEQTYAAYDILSNGLKMRAANGNVNISGATYIYAAFAESPFKYATAGATVVRQFFPAMEI